MGTVPAKQKQKKLSFKTGSPCGVSKIIWVCISNYDNMHACMFCLRYKLHVWTHMPSRLTRGHGSQGLLLPPCIILNSRVSYMCKCLTHCLSLNDNNNNNIKVNISSRKVTIWWQRAHLTKKKFQSYRCR